MWLVTLLQSLLGALAGILGAKKAIGEALSKDTVTFVIESEKALEKIKYGKTKEERLDGLDRLRNLINDL